MQGQNCFQPIVTRATLPHCCRFVLRLKKGRRLKICTARVATKLKNVKAAVVPFFCTSPLLLLSCGPSKVQVLNRKFLGSKTFVSSDHAEDAGRNHSLCPVYQVSFAPPPAAAAGDMARWDRSATASAEAVAEAVAEAAVGYIVIDQDK